MSLFDWLLIVHLIGDYSIQTQFEALNKALGKFLNRALFSHCIKYTLCFIPTVVSYHINPLWLIWILGTHLILDRRWLIIAWRTYVNRNTEASIEKSFWLTIMNDQTFHLLVLAVVAWANK